MCAIFVASSGYTSQHRSCLTSIKSVTSTQSADIEEYDPTDAAITKASDYELGKSYRDEWLDPSQKKMHDTKCRTLEKNNDDFTLEDRRPHERRCSQNINDHNKQRDRSSGYDPDLVSQTSPHSRESDPRGLCGDSRRRVHSSHHSADNVLPAKRWCPTKGDGRSQERKYSRMDREGRQCRDVRPEGDGRQNHQRIQERPYTGQDRLGRHREGEIEGRHMDRDRLTTQDQFIGQGSDPPLLRQDRPSQSFVNQNQDRPFIGQNQHSMIQHSGVPFMRNQICHVKQHDEDQQNNQHQPLIGQNQMQNQQPQSRMPMAQDRNFRGHKQGLPQQGLQNHDLPQRFYQPRAQAFQMRDDPPPSNNPPPYSSVTPRGPDYQGSPPTRMPHTQYRQQAPSLMNIGEQRFPYGMVPNVQPQLNRR